MTKFFKVSFLAMLIVAVMALPAFAGVISFWGAGGANTQTSVALEAMNAARNFTMASSSGTTSYGLANAAILITPGQQLASGSLLTISFTNANFTTATVSLCAETNDTTDIDSPVATYTPSAVNSSVTFVLGNTVASGQKLFLTTAVPTSCQNSNASFIVQFTPVSSAALASVAYNVALSGTVYDSKSAVNFANISRYYTTNYGASTTIIDYANSTTSNGTQFLTTNAVALNTASSSSANITTGSANVTPTGAPANLTVAAMLGLQDSANWQGVKDVYATSGSCGVNKAGANNAINTTFSGSVANLAIAANAFNGSSSYAAAVCVDVTGTTALQSRTIKAAYTITGGITDTDAFTTIATWTPNGYTGIITYMNGSSVYNTTCTLNNNSSTAAPATFTVLSSESLGASSTAIPATMQGLSLGTIPANGTIRVDFNSVITTYTYSGGVESANATTINTGLAANDRFSGMLSIGGSVPNITVNCLQIDPATGAKRNVPVLTQTSSSNPWQQ